MINMKHTDQAAMRKCVLSFRKARNLTCEGCIEYHLWGGPNASLPLEVFAVIHKINKGSSNDLPRIDNETSLRP